MGDIDPYNITRNHLVDSRRGEGTPPYNKTEGFNTTRSLDRICRVGPVCPAAQHTGAVR